MIWRKLYYLELSFKRDDWMMASSLLDVASKATFSRESGKTKQRKDKQKKEAEDERLVWQII